MFKKLNEPPHAVKDAYNNCGRRVILSKSTRKWIVSQLVSRRRKQEVTSTDLQAELAKEKGIHVEASSVRRAFKAEGYRYSSRFQKPRHNKEQKTERRLFVEWLAAMSLDMSGEMASNRIRQLTSTSRIQDNSFNSTVAAVIMFTVMTIVRNHHLHRHPCHHHHRCESKPRTQPSRKASVQLNSLYGPACAVFYTSKRVLRTAKKDPR